MPRDVHVDEWWLSCGACGGERVVQEGDGPECPLCGSESVYIEPLTPCPGVVLSDSACGMHATKRKGPASTGPSQAFEPVQAGRGDRTKR